VGARLHVSSPSLTIQPRAAVLTVGDELIAGDIVDTNAARLGQRCRVLGLELRTMLSVRDRVDEIAAAVRELAASHDVLLVSGGLGPTTDDLTTAAVAVAAGVALVRDGGAIERLESKFRAFARPMPDANRKQADFPAGATILANPIGTAEGFALAVGACTVFVMPGVPRELHKMMDEQVEPMLRPRLGAPIARRIWRVLGIGESAVAQRIEPVIARARAASVGMRAAFVHYRASMPEVTVIVEGLRDADGHAATERELAALDEPMAAALAPGFYGVGEDDLPTRLVAALTAAGLHVALAESCTAGAATAAIGGVPRASACLLGAVVSYDDAVKKDLLGVPGDLLAAHGAVSEPVARAMAEGVRRSLHADLSVAITGIAGPTGGSAEKPVGTVHIAVADAEITSHLALQLRGDRGMVQRAAALWALKLLWDRLKTRNDT
jgi:nicotinamide-nucleotide amidase